MKAKKKLAREQLNSALQRFRPLLEVTVPPKGWIRAIRDVLGMSARQLADRLGVAQQSVTRIEKGELTGSLTLKTMRRIADGLDCVFVYALVPRTSLADTVYKQAKRVAGKRLAQASQTMTLEEQGLSKEENEQVLSDMIEELMDNPPTNLWDE